MQLYPTADYASLSRQAGNLLAAQVLQKPDSVLGLATGGTPVGAYARLTALHRQGDLDFSRVTTVNLDEYLGLAPAHPQSYSFFMHQHLFDLVNLRPDCCHLPQGHCADPAAECRRYEQLIDHLGGIDLQLLGIGGNGHIGFNEPDAQFSAATHPVTLTEQTRQANRRFFASLDEVPRQALTMGVGTIFRARHILLLANGEAKAQALYDALWGPITPRVPASILQLHPAVTVVADAAALSVAQREGRVAPC